MSFPIVDDTDELIITGTHISELEEDSDFLSDNCGFSFIDIFGYDENGYYATFNDFTSEDCKSKIIYIDYFLNMYFVADNFSVFVNALLNGDLTKHKYKTNDLTIYSSYINANKHLEKDGKLYIS